MNTSQDIKMQMVDDNVGNQVRQNVVQNDENKVGQNEVKNSGIQNVENMNGLIVVSEISNQYGNENVVTAPAEGNGNGINGNPIRCYNCRREGHYASNCTVKPRKRDAAYLQQQLQIAQEEEAGIQSTQVECEFMAAADAYEETERVKVNCTLEDTLQQASLSGTQSDNAPVYDSDGSTEVPKDENCYDHDIFNMHTHEVQYTDLQTELDRTKEKLENCIIKKEKEYAVLWNNWYTKCEECKYDKISYDKAYNDMQQKIERLQAQLGDLKGKSCDTQCASNTLDPLFQKLEDEKVSLESQVLNYAKENAHLKTTYKNLFDSIKVTQAQTNSIIDSLQKQLYDTIYDNAKLRAQLFDKVSERKGTTKGTRTNTMFTKQSILGKPPSSSYKPKLYFVTPFPKSSVLPKVDKTNALSKPVTSNSAPSTRESKGVQTVKVIASRYNVKSSIGKHDPPEADESLAKHKALELEIERLLKAVFSQDIMSIVQNPSVVDSSNLQTELKPINLGKATSFLKTKKYSCTTPFPKSTVIPNVGKSNALSKHFTSNLAPSSHESSVVNNERVIAPGIFRINSFKASRNGFSPNNVERTTRTRRPQPRNNPKSDKVPFKSRSSYLSNKLEKIKENHRSLQSSNNLDHTSSECNNIKLAIRNEKSEYVNGMKSRKKNQSAYVSKSANQKKHKPKVRKPKKVGSKERLASPKPSTPSSCLRWSPTGRMFDLKGKIIATSESVCQSDCSKGCQNWFDTLLIPLLSEYKSKDKETHGDNECDN
ncbi:gag-pol polyprotein [Tanacetum coccineum]